jgi:hypothetical protein
MSSQIEWDEINTYVGLLEMLPFGEECGLTPFLIRKHLRKSNGSDGSIGSITVRFQDGYALFMRGDNAVARCEHRLIRTRSKANFDAENTFRKLARAELSTRARNALAWGLSHCNHSALGPILSFYDLQKWSRDDLGMINHVGVGTINEIEAFANRHGVELAP